MTERENPGSEDLRNALRRLASWQEGPGEQAEERLLAGFRAWNVQRRRRRRVQLMSVAALIALVCGLAAVLASRSSRDVNARTMAGPAQELSGFMILPYAQSGVPMDEAVIVRVRMSASRLSVMGVPYVSATSNQEVRADLLVGQDGVARAVRFVQ